MLSGSNKWQYMKTVYPLARALLNTRDRALRLLLVKKHQERRWGGSCQGAGSQDEAKKLSIPPLLASARMPVLAASTLIHSFHRLLLAGTPTTAKRSAEKYAFQPRSAISDLDYRKLPMPSPSVFERRCWRPRQQQKERDREPAEAKRDGMSTKVRN